MELRQLRYFLAVAEELNFTRAARRVGIAQPPLSQQIGGLERELKAILFNRSKRHVSLTPSGEALLAHARRILNLTSEAAEAVKAAAKGETGTLSIGAIFSSMYTLVPHALSRLSTRQPAIQFRLQEMTVAQQLKALREGGIDIGIMRGPFSEHDLVTCALVSEPFVVALPANHPLARKKRLHIDEVAGQPMIGITPALNHDFNARMFAAFFKRDERLNIVQEVDDTHTLISLVGAGVGLSMVPTSLRAISIRRVVYRPLVEATPMTTLQLTWHRDSGSRSVPHFVAAAQAAVADVEQELAADDIRAFAVDARGVDGP